MSSKVCQACVVCQALPADYGFHDRQKILQHSGSPESQGDQVIPTSRTHLFRVDSVPCAGS